MSSPALRRDEAAEPVWPGLDPVERRIIGRLQDDARVSVAAMAKDLGLAPATVRTRLQRLYDRGYVRWVALVDPATFGRPVVGQVTITLDGTVDEAVGILAGNPETAYLATLPDLRSVNVQVSVADNAALMRFVNTVLRPLPGLADIVVAVQLRSWSAMFGYGAPAGETVLWRGGPARAVDDTDLAILRLLEEDARMTVTAMAAQVGLSVPAARQRLLRLRSDGVVHLRTKPDPSSPDVTLVRVLAGVDRDSTGVAETVVQLPHVIFVSETTGHAGLVVDLVCPGETEVQQGLSAVRGVEGVVSAELVRFREIVVWKGHW